jgi:heme A synthase
MFADYEYETTVAFRTIRRVALFAAVIAFVHIVFGAIVRISGSGMGCGDNWPKCSGHWIPPMSRPDLIVEVTHRYLASILALVVITLFVSTWRARGVPRVGGTAGPLATAAGALGAVVATALLGSVTVHFQNALWATVAHLVLAMTLLALLVMTIVRSSTGPDDDRRVSPRAARASIAAASLAAIAVTMGGVTAKYVGAPIACPAFPLCGTNPDVSAAAAWVQITHRAVAILLILHLFGQVMTLRKRRATEAPVVVRAASIAFGLALLQLVVAGAMIGMKLPPVLRSVHQAVGVSIWISTFSFAYIAWRGSRPVVEEALVPVQRTSGQRKTIARQSLGTRELE